MRSTIGPSPRPGKPYIQSTHTNKNNQIPSTTGSFSQNQLPKREITFPTDSVEATLPVLYRRKRISRVDCGPVDAWRIIMCLRSGLLSESCYALDILNILLFDDIAVGYFTLNQWIGLLDLLLEHFRRALSDMFDGPFPREIKSDEIDVDLGGINTAIDIEDKTVLLEKTENYAFVTRKGYAVKLIDKNEDIFIHDHHKDWDTNGDATGINILAEIATDPWHSSSHHILPTFQAEFCHIPFNLRIENTETNDVLGERTPHRTVQAEAIAFTNKHCDRKRRTKSLSDVISRIKKENDAFDLESKGKVKTEIVSEKRNCSEQSSVDLNFYNSEDFSDSAPSVNDPACTLKRRKISDYEDEAYARDEASLVLLTESQDCLAKRCVCISNILRSLTFIPGNEGEFARNSSFLALVGKLLLLNHDHPLRIQKTKNYDREVSNNILINFSSFVVIRF